MGARLRTWCLCAVMMLSASAVASAGDWYMKVTGALQGAFAGLPSGAHAGFIPVLEFEYVLRRAYSSTGTTVGTPVGALQHMPVQVVFDWDVASVLFTKAIFTDENLTTVTLEYWEKNATGVEEKIFTVALKGCRVINNVMSNDASNADDDVVVKRGYHVVDMIFSELNFTHTKSAKTVRDLWQAPTN